MDNGNRICDKTSSVETFLLTTQHERFTHMSDNIVVAVNTCIESGRTIFHGGTCTAF